MFSDSERWKVNVKNYRLKIKGFMSDNGGEDDNIEFKKFFVDSEIRWIKTVYGKLKQNGIDEKINKMLNKTVRFIE